MLIFSVVILAIGVFEAAAVYHWEPYTMNSPLPEDAVIGGREPGKHLIYVGRTLIDGNWLTVKFIPASNYAALAFNGKEIPVKSFQLLVGANLDWVSAKDGEVPKGSVEGGKTQYGETIYVGRAPFKGSLTVGRVQPSKKGIIFPFSHKERFDSKYEVLVESKLTRR